MEVKSEENLFADFYNSTRDLILDRVSNPLIFSFVIAWLLSNYKVVMVIFTQQTEAFVFDYKIQLIDSYLEINHGLIYPLIGACFYTFMYPFIEQKVAKFTLKRKLEIRGDKNLIEKAELKTADEVKAIHLRHFKIEQQYKQEIDNLRAGEAQLRTQIESLQSLINTSNKKKEFPQSNVDFLEGSINELTNTEVMLIKIIGSFHNKNKAYVSFDDIKQTGIQKVDFDIAMSNLVSRNLLLKTSNQSYRLEKQGLIMFKKLQTMNDDKI